MIKNFLAGLAFGVAMVGAADAQGAVRVTRGAAVAAVERSDEAGVRVWRGSAPTRDLSAALEGAAPAAQIIEQRITIVRCGRARSQVRTQGFFAGHPGFSRRFTQGFYSGAPDFGRCG
jgi:hypothetical protein